MLTGGVDLYRFVAGHQSASLLYMRQNERAPSQTPSLVIRTAKNCGPVERVRVRPNSPYLTLTNGRTTNEINNDK